MKLTEPTTAFTDYLLTAETILLGILLFRFHSAISIKFWAVAFLILGVAAAAGGTYHGFINSMGPSTANVIWKITLYCIGISTLLMLSAVLLAYLPNPWKGVFLAITFLQLLYYIYVTSHSNDFKYVIYNYVPAMIVVLILAAVHKNLWLVGAVFISFAGALVQRSGLTLHKHFNFNDMYHLIQMVGMYFFYRGGKLLVAP